MKNGNMEKLDKCRKTQNKNEKNIMKQFNIKINYMNKKKE
jgi:hypothetical protein